MSTGPTLDSTLVDGVAAYGDPLNEHRIDGDAHKNQHSLEFNGKQGLQIVLAHAAQFPVEEGRHGQRGQTLQLSTTTFRIGLAISGTVRGQPSDASSSLNEHLSETQRFIFFSNFCVRFFGKGSR